MKCEKIDSEVANCDHDCERCPVVLDADEAGTGERRGRDRTSVVVVGCFTLSTDRDHKGNYRGGQAMEKGRYRGWHFHLESTEHTPDQVMDLLEAHLASMGTERYEPERLAIGVVEAKPKRVSSWRSAVWQATEVLWISGSTGSLHVEANKTAAFTKALLSKKDLLAVAKKNSALVIIGNAAKRAGQAVHCQYCFVTADLVEMKGGGYFLCKDHLKRALGDGKATPAGRCMHLETYTKEVTDKNGVPTGTEMRYCNLCGVDLGEVEREGD